MNEETLLPILLGEFRDRLQRIQVVNRDVKFPNAPNKIKVAVGMRRTGKTYFLFQQILTLVKEGFDPKSILYVNFEDDRLLPLTEKTIAGLVDAFYALYPENHDRKCCYFFDEIQNVANWSTVIRRLHDSKNAEIFLTGSSAKLLSKEIASSLRGRSLAVEIWPYSFHEFLRAKEIAIDQDLYDKKTHDKLAKIFSQYLSEGGFPEVTDYEFDVRQRTLQDYLDIVIYRDIIERHQIKSPVIIKNLILGMVHNISKPFTISKFYNDFKTRGYQISKESLYEYTDHIEDTYLSFSVPLHDKSIRKVQTNPKKWYFIDSGMARALTLDYESDLGRLFENMVYLDLRRLGCQVFYYLTAERYEVDFLVQSPRGHKKLFQVTWKMQDQKTQERENRALQAAMNELNVEGQIVTLESYLRDGIYLS